MPAYNAEKTLCDTYAEIPRDLVDEVVVVDDASPEIFIGDAVKREVSRAQLPLLHLHGYLDVVASGDGGAGVDGEQLAALMSGYS